jgi:hypothetical protein
MSQEKNEVSIMNQSNSEATQAVERTVRLSSGVFRLDRQVQTLRVVYGLASVKMGEKDFLLTSGEEMHITTENENVLVEALKQRPLLFQIYPN